MNSNFFFPIQIQNEPAQEREWISHDRVRITRTQDTLSIAGGWVSLCSMDQKDFLLEFYARAPRDASQVQIWAGIRHFNRDYRYVAALRGGSNQHLYLARLGAEGYDKMLALRPLEWIPQPGVWYRFRILAKDSTIAFYLGDDPQPLLCVKDEDTPFHSGSIALGGSYLPAEFKNISIQNLDHAFLDENTRTLHIPTALGETLLSLEKAPDYMENLTPGASEKESRRKRDRSRYRPFDVRLPAWGRGTYSLDGEWLFLPDYEIAPAVEGTSAADPAAMQFDDSKAHLVPVPSCWIPLQAWLEGENMGNLNKGMNDDYLVEETLRCLNQTFDYRRTNSAWYRHYLDFPENICEKHVTLDFEGIALISVIYWNGNLVRRNIGMFAPMEVDVTPYIKPGRNLLAIEVSRRLSREEESTLTEEDIDDKYTAAWNILSGDQDIAPNGQKAGDSSVERRPFCTNDIAHGFYGNNPGGIWRSVHLTVSDPCHVVDCYFQPTLSDAAIEVCYENKGAACKQLVLSYSLTHKTTGEMLCQGIVEKTALEPGKSRTVSFRTPQVKPRLWGPGTPNLYDLTFTLSMERMEASSREEILLDIFHQQVGFRTVSFQGSTLLYNGKPLWVRGGNHMPAHVRPTDAALARTFIKLAVEHNVIATRTHVAPWSSVWLDAADEEGLMVSLEGTWSWLMLEHIPSRQSIHLWKQEFVSLLRRHRNRPSLFLLTMNNEMKFYLHGDPDPVIREKGLILEEGIRAARKTLPHLPLVCDSAYYRKHAIHTGRYENIILANHLDDGDMDDPHGYFGWYNPSFFHFMNGEFGRDYTLPGRPCMSQECSVGYPRAQDGLPTRAYLFMHQTPQTTVGKKAYEFCNPAFFLSRHAFLVKELVEMFRRVEHQRTCGVILFAFETWFYHQHNSSRIAPMLSAEKLKLAYQPVLASVELWGRHFCAGDELTANLTVINDSSDCGPLENCRVSVRILGPDNGCLAETQLEFPVIPYFETVSQGFCLPLPQCLPRERTEGRLVVTVHAADRICSENEYEILLAEKNWAREHSPEISCRFLAGDLACQKLLEHLGIAANPCGSLKELAQTKERLIIAAPYEGEETSLLKEKDYAQLRAFAAGGGKVVLLGQKSLPASLFDGEEIPFTGHRQEIVTMNIPESSLFDGIQEEDLAWFGDGRQVPYAALGRYSANRFRDDFCVLAETLEWHGYINHPTDYRRYGGSPLFTARVGAGNLLISALRTDAVFSDPVASRLTANMISFDFRQDNH